MAAATHKLELNTHIAQANSILFDDTQNVTFAPCGQYIVAARHHVYVFTIESIVVGKSYSRHYMVYIDRMQLLKLKTESNGLQK